MADADDFLAREAAILGTSFSPSNGNSGGGGDIDFDRAASAFPELDLDTPIPQPSVRAQSHGGGLLDGFGDEFDEFPAAAAAGRDVKITGDDEVGKFESEFPDISRVSRQ